MQANGESHASGKQCESQATIQWNWICPLVDLAKHGDFPLLACDSINFLPFFGGGGKLTVFKESSNCMAGRVITFGEQNPATASIPLPVRGFKEYPQDTVFVQR